jgi:hypothetical protein
LKFFKPPFLLGMMASVDTSHPIISTGHRLKLSDIQNLFITIILFLVGPVVGPAVGPVVGWFPMAECRAVGVTGRLLVLQLNCVGYMYLSILQIVLSV